MGDWLYERLGIGLLREDAQGGVSANARAKELLSGVNHPTLGMALAALLGSAATGELEPALARARTGIPSELVSPGGLRVLISRDAEGVNAVLAPVVSDVGAQVSHELANALGAIAGWARLARQGQRVEEALRLIEMSADSAWSAARRLLGEARLRHSKSENESVELSAFVDEAAKLLGPKALGKGVEVRTAIEPALRVRADRGSVWSIIWNLSANAVEAVPRGGAVELRLVPSADSVVLTVEDDGPGMSQEQQQRAFEPYFTTKPTGTGLGLAVVKQAVAELGGRIELKSEPGLGTRFTVVLPRVGTLSQRPAPTKRSSGVFYAEPLYERVLVVDDDLGLREMVSTALSMRGAEVVAVGTAEEALAQRGRFGVVIIDLLLGEMRGDALLAALRQSGLARLGLLMTGAEIPDALAPGGAPEAALRKPFELEELFDTLADVLKRAAERRSAVG